MQAHRFIRIDNLDTGRIHSRELSAAEAASRYPAEILTLLAQGKTVRIGNELHLDLMAFVEVKRELPEAMTCQTRRSILADRIVNLAARRHGLPQLSRA